MPITRATAARNATRNTTRNATRNATVPYEGFTEEMCREWASNPTRNPITGKQIKKNTAVRPNVYDRIAEACARYGIQPQGSSKSSRSKSRSSSDENKSEQKTKTIPKSARRSVYGIAFPNSLAEWKSRMTYIADMYDKIIGMEIQPKDALRDGKLKYILKEDSEDTEAFIIHYENAMKYNIHNITNQKVLDDLKEVYEFAKVLKKLELKEKPTDVPILNERHWNTFNMYISTGDRHYQNNLKVLLEQAEIHLNYLETPGAQELVTKIKDLIEIIDSMELEKAEDVQIMEDVIPESRLRTSPSSLSSESDRSRKYSSSYKRHSKLSLVSPFEHASPSAPEINNKTRKEILKDLKQTCTDLRDTITYERFDRMNKKNLLLVVKLGEGEKNKHCFYVRNIYNAWNQATKDNKPFTDPLNGVPVTQDEKNDIMSKMRYLKKNAKDPRDIKQAVPKTLELVFIPHVHTDENGIETDFYNIQLRTKHRYANRIIILMNLGYIPSNIEPSDIDGALNMSSSVLITHIQKLFDTGRLLSKNRVPYQCCRVHLRKPIEYWLDLDGPKGISKHRFVLMVQEIERYL